MAPLPKSFSLKVIPIRSAISEGKAEEAMQKLTALLETGEADSAIQILAAEWILAVGLKPGDAKRLRKGHAKLPDDWHDIAQTVISLQDDGMTYEQATREAAMQFNCSERHAQTCTALWNQPRYSGDEFE